MWWCNTNSVFCLTPPCTFCLYHVPGCGYISESEWILLAQVARQMYFHDQVLRVGRCIFVIKSSHESTSWSF